MIQAVVYFISWLLWTLSTAWFSANLVKAHYGRPYPFHFMYTPSFFNHFMHWDTLWYTYVALYGYRYTNTELPTIAFFPGYPMIIKFIHSIVGENIALLYILPSIAFQGGSIYVMYLLLKDLNKKDSVVYPVLLSFCFYPGSFFGMTAYPVSAMVFFATTTFYFLRKRKWLLSSIMSGSGTLFGPLPVFLAVVVFFEIKQYRGIKKSIIYGLLSLWGVTLFSLYCLLRFGDPLAFVHAQNWWGDPNLFKRLFNIFRLIVNDVPYFPLSTSLGVYKFDNFINLLLLILYTFIIIFVMDRLPIHYTLYAFLILIEYLWALGGITINTTAFARLSYISVPLFIGIAEILDDYPSSGGIIIPFFFFGNFILESLFVRNYWAV